MKVNYQPFQPTITPPGLNRFGLSLQQVSPCSRLQGIVHSYLQVDAAKPTPYTVMPDGTQAVFISANGSRVGGALTKARDLQILHTGGYFGIRFYPGGLRYFFDLDLCEINDQFADDNYLPCHDFGVLHHQIYEKQGFFERARVCEQWLLRHYKPQAGTRFDQALSLVYRHMGNIKVGQLADKIGWSSRHLNRQFRLHTGLNIKAFAQTIRMQHVCKQLYSSPGTTLNIAHELGFFDQAHLINDFKKRLFINPSSFINQFMSDFYNP